VCVMETVELLTAMAGDRALNRLPLFILFVNQIAHSELLQGMYFSASAWRRTQQLSVWMALSSVS
jgi:hypothetical protein